MHNKYKILALLMLAQSALFAITDISDITLKGRMGDVLDKMIENHVTGTDVDYITAPFQEKTERKNWWHTEFWGKFMHSAVPYCRYSHSEKLRANIERGIERIIASQEPCGYIGNYPDELRLGEGWDVWGIKYTMMGLLHYYDATKSEKALSACKKLCDYVIAEIGPNGKRGVALWQTGNWSGYASSSILEPVMWLYKRTNDKKYLDFASYIVDGMKKPEAGPRLVDLALKGISVADRTEYGRKNTDYTHWQYVCKFGRSKAYEMMSCYQGMLEYYDVTGDKELYYAALATANDIVKEEINLAGGCASTEAWFHGRWKQERPFVRLQETCVTTTWMRFCEKLLDETDDPQWADQIEKTFYNAYLAAMKPDGKEFAGYTPLSGNRWHGQHHCYMHTDCCTANGPRGFLVFLKNLFNVGKKDVMTFNFFASALVKDKLPESGKNVAFDMYSLYPSANYVRIVSHCDGVEAPLRLRIPAWCSKATVKLNGKGLENAKGGSYYTIAHKWQLGDIIELRLDMNVVVHKLKHHVAFTRGPVLLARDSRFHDGDLAEPMTRTLYDNPGKVPQFNQIKPVNDEIWMMFDAVLPYGMHNENPDGALPSSVRFCDYASAGNEWSRENYYRTWFPVLVVPAAHGGEKD